jgi:hypothetical protein
MLVSFRSGRRACLGHLLLGGLVLAGTAALALPNPPAATNRWVWEEVSENFEAPWVYTANLPKTDFQSGGGTNAPHGTDNNGFILEDTWCGGPDLVDAVATPGGGPAGSTLALRMQTTDSNVSSAQPYRRDGLAGNISGLVGAIPWSQSPAVQVSVYVPPTATWAQPDTPAANSTYLNFYFGPELATTAGNDWPWLYTVAAFDGAGNRAGQYWAMDRYDAGGNWYEDDFLAIPDSTEGQWYTIGWAAEGTNLGWYLRSGVGDLTESDFVGYMLVPGSQAYDVTAMNVLNIGLYARDGIPSPDWIMDNLMVLIPEPGALTLGAAGLLLLMRRRVRR